jgi:hypothetical protein
VDRSTLGAYSLHEPLGRGASGEVWRGTSRLDGSAVAVKVLRPELADDAEAVARLLGEREVLTGIESPHLVPVRDVVVEGDTVAVVMDLAAGVDLRRLLRASPTQPPALACVIVGQVAAGLAAVHEAGVVHRDVKPENVLVDLSTTDAPVARLTDFGIAGFVAGAARTSGVVGTPEYLAPEVAEGAPTSPAADVYSLGILLYELCAGRTPFAGGHPVAVLRRQLEDPPLRPPGLPAPLWGLLSWMLDKSPGARPSADEVAEALEDLAEAFAGRPALEPLPAFDADEPTDPGSVVAAPPSALPAAAAPRPFRPGARSHRPPAAPAARRGRSRALLFAAPLVVALVAAALVGIQRLEHSPSGPYRFAPFLLRNGLAVERTWRFGDAQGAVVLGTAEVHNRTEKPFTGAFDEVLPASMVRDPAKVQRTPAGESPPNDAGDPVLRFAITDLDPGYFWRISYRVEVPPDGTSSGRLEDWAADQRKAFERWGRTTAGRAQGVPNVLVSFDVGGPESVTLPVGARYQLPLEGRMADGTPAPASVLALVRWETDDPTVATVRSGLVEARKEGSTDIRAQTEEFDGWSGSVEVVPRGTAEVPASTFTLPSIPKLAPDAPFVDDPTREGVGLDPQPTVTQCANGEDDDHDGLVDTDDRGCTDAQDDDEGGDPVAACANGVDDDGDQVADMDDPGCSSSTDDDETDVATACSNGVDDDADGKVDMVDPGCASADDGDETDPAVACANGVDDDGDGSIDAADPGCSSATDDDETNLLAACANLVDDDGDGLIDMADTGCTDPGDTDESGGVNTLPACANGVDDDADGKVDLADLGCETPLDADETDRTGGSTDTTLPPPPEPSRDVAGTTSTLEALAVLTARSRW